MYIAYGLLELGDSVEILGLDLIPNHSKGIREGVVVSSGPVSVLAAQCAVLVRPYGQSEPVSRGFRHGAGLVERNSELYHLHAEQCRDHAPMDGLPARQESTNQRSFHVQLCALF